MRKARRLAFYLLIAGATVSACDPDLHIVKHSVTDGGSERSQSSVQPSPAGSSGDASTDLDAGGDASLPEEDSGSTPTGHKIDGINDFASNEKLPTTSSGSDYYAYVAWDAARLYFGMSGSDVGSKASNKWVHVYLGVPGVTGTRTGIDYAGQQQPTLPFDATHHLRWKASGDYTTVEIYDGGSWKTANPALVPIVAAQQGTFMEMSITRASINATGKLAVHMNMLIEGGGADWTFAGAPSTSFTDGKDPDFGKYLELDLEDTTTPPNAYVAK